MLSNISEILKNPKSKSKIQAAIRHEQRLRFHAEKCLEAGNSEYLNDFINWVSSLLPKDKAEYFKKMLTFPIYSNELVESISDELIKVFDGQDSSLNFQFKSDTHDAIFNQYLNDIDFAHKWEADVTNSFISYVNSLVVVDVKDGFPFHYLLTIDKIKDISVSGGIDYIIAEYEKDLIVSIDSQSYDVYKKDGDKYNLVSTNPHKIGYTPVCFLWDVPLSRRDNLIKASELTPSLTNLDWLVFWEVSRRCLEMYAAFPIDIMMEGKCTYNETFEGHTIYCENGYINRGDRGTVECPACSKKRLIGAGSLLTVPMPKGNDDPNNLEAIKRISADVPSLEYAQKELDRIWDEIYYSCVGYGGEQMSKEAVNTTQVKSNYESKLQVILRIKRVIEKSQSFVLKTMGKIMFGESMVSVSVNLGTSFYLETLEGATNTYKNIKASGSPVYMLSYGRKKIDGLSVKDNDNEASRAEIMRQIEPYIDLSINDCKSLGIDVIDAENFYIKSNLSSLIMRFEREYGDIVLFGSKIEFKTKIEKILSILNNYGKENRNNARSGNVRESRQQQAI